MAIVVDWTKSLDVARLHADPSGVQEQALPFKYFFFRGGKSHVPQARIWGIVMLSGMRLLPPQFFWKGHPMEPVQASFMRSTGKNEIIAQH